MPGLARTCGSTPRKRTPMLLPTQHDIVTVAVNPLWLAHKRSVALVSLTNSHSHGGPGPLRYRIVGVLPNGRSNISQTCLEPTNTHPDDSHKEPGQLYRP
jgi:hypothetical protein